MTLVPHAATNTNWRKLKRQERDALQEACVLGELACELKVGFGYLKRNPYPPGRRHDIWQREYERLDDAFDWYPTRE